GARSAAGPRRRAGRVHRARVGAHAVRGRDRPGVEDGGPRRHRGAAGGHGRPARLMAAPAVLPGVSGGDLRLLSEEAGSLLERLRQHGGGPDGSVTRLVYGEAWLAAMAEIEEWLAGCGLEVRTDAVGSRFGRLAGDGDGVVLTGSHVDSVVDGGAYDGIAGVVMAGCAVGWLAGSLGRPVRTLEVFANCEEESSRF